MSARAAKILVIEGDRELGERLKRILEEEGYEVRLEERGDIGFNLARAEAYDLVLTDLRLPGKGGLELVRDLHLVKPRLPLILMTAHGTAETAIQATKDGAFDYFLKPFEIDDLLASLETALDASRLMSEPVALGPASVGGQVLIGRSRVMQMLYKEIGRVASRPVNVLLLGATGTGKELIARAIYQHSHRAKEPFVAINCAAIPETLLESELFGHERGAFTGAHNTRVGRFEQATHGTIFLDEIGEMGLGTQVKLLRVIQEQQIERLGGKSSIPVDVRVIAATNRDLETAVAEGRFRQDLYFRLSVAVLRLPSLRERAEDVPELVTHFLQKYGPELGNPKPAIQPAAMTYLSRQPWPGNVREVENVVRKMLLLTRGFPITLEHAQSVTAQGAGPAGGPESGLAAYIADVLAEVESGASTDAHHRVIEAVERELFRQAILLTQGNQAKAARWLGVSRLTMRAKLMQFGLHPGRQDEVGM